MENQSGLKPRGRAVIVTPYEPEIHSSVIEIPASVQAKMHMIDQRAVVVAVGSEAWKDESEPRAVPGDKVMIAKYSGVLVTGPADGKVYRIINANDIFTVIEEEENHG